jgi:hypothetical protein
MPAESLPFRFNPNDPKLKFVRIFDLKKEIGSIMLVGKCPYKPCFGLKL